MGNVIPRIAAIHDLSGFGRCSLTVVMPILSSMGLQVCPLPTAVLSTHTGGFKDYSFLDLTDEMTSIKAHWQKLSLDFDCIYSGFLGSIDQINIVSDFIKCFHRQNQLVVVDPVMADNGKLYDTYTFEMVEKMRKLIESAYLITPNITEAALLLGKEYPEALTDDEIKDWLVGLSDMGPEIVVITSTPDKVSHKYCIVAYDKNSKQFWKVQCDYLPADYPGTGDIYTSVLIGALLQKDSLPVSMDRAEQFVASAIIVTYGYKTAPREGVLFEKVLHTLNTPLSSHRYKNF